jgi:hypothetical protein
MVTAGLNDPPEMGPPNKTPIAKAAPIAAQFPVAKITKTKNKGPKNSTIYLFIICIMYIIFYLNLCK